MEPADRRFFSGLFVAVIAVGVLGYSTLQAEKPVPAPMAQPAAPAACDGRCSRSTPARPFRVVCPFCRNALVATPPETGEVGALVKPDAPAAK